MADNTNGNLNGIDTVGLKGVMAEVSADPPKGAVDFEVASEWKGQCKVQTYVASYNLGGQTIERTQTISSDEPNELLGENAAPNPQELLMAAFNSCIMVGYTVGAAMKGIKLEKLVVKTKGTLDLRGFLGLDPNVSPGYENLTYEVQIKGDGTPEQFQEIHENVNATSPNRWNIANAISLDGKLLVE